MTRNNTSATIHSLRGPAPPREPRPAYTLAVRGGYTLAEMLIVMTIMLMLVVVALPAVKRVMEDGNVREASRQLNAYFAMAKARALQTGRPCGVMMMCDPVLGITEPNPGGSVVPNWPTKQITKMYLAEVPPPYSGGTIGARGRIMATTLTTAPLTYEFVPLAPGGFTLDTSERSILASLLQVGETFLVRFDLQGAWYACQYYIDSTGVPRFVFQSPGGSGIPPVGIIILPSTIHQGVTSTNSVTPLPPSMAVASHPGYPYQIIRMPRRIGNPLELTAGTCIDVAYCGVGPTNGPTNTLQYGMYDPAPSGTMTAAALFPGSPPAPKRLQAITVMFTPGGGIDSVFLNNLPFSPPTTVHFLLGRADKLNDPFGSSSVSATGLNMFDPEASNLSDPKSLWVSIARSTGNVNTSDNLPPPGSNPSPTNLLLFENTTREQPINPGTNAGQITYLAYCRQLATNREQMRGQ
jgi:prepilin-type N-terminal cleavage/methylation domain-containing protein